MNIIDFFTPKYIDLSSTHCACSANSISALKFYVLQRLVNTAEFLFDFRCICDLFKQNQKQLSQSNDIDLVNVRKIECITEKKSWPSVILQTVALTISAKIYPLGIILLGIKSACYWKNLDREDVDPKNNLVDVENELLLDGVITPSEEEISQTLTDGRIALDTQCTHCILLKKDGAIYLSLLDEIQTINKLQDFIRAETLIVHLYYFKKYYEALSDQPISINSIPEIHEAIESLICLQEMIFVNKTPLLAVNFNFVDVTKKVTDCRGIHNVGNSCYIASVIQMIFSLPQLRSELENLTISELNYSPMEHELFIKHQKLASALKLCLEAHAECFVRSEIDAALEELQRTLLEIGLIEEAKDPTIEMESTLTFLSEIGTSENDLKHLRDDLEEIKKNSKNWKIKSQGEPWEILQNLICMLDKQILLKACFSAIDVENALLKENKISEDRILIPIEIENKEFTFEKGLKKYFSEKMIAEDAPIFDFYLKDGGQKKASLWSEKKSISAVPSYFIVQLNRSVSNGKAIEYYRDVVAVDTANIDLSDCLEEGLELGECSVKYRICSVIIHKGTASQGHYFALKSDEKGNWYKCDDDKVTEVTGGNLTELMGSGYLFLLEKI